ncbi:TetR/AcrR family transcriptional regulator [Microlunatus elymi]|uniref:TetR/AcrR family transcriptional regulator n=1 Tax=Microlunatus elymi TaxID=2596828 RepID=UPI00143D79DE|nr:TetR family transcriptional regulator [Microlunatus elymi]
MPVKPPVTRLRTVANPADPRYRRTRAQICDATRRLLEVTDVQRLTFGQVAAAADVNRSTVHQHYGSRHELVADALATDLAGLADALDRCPFDRSGGVPAELVEMFAAVEDQAAVLDRLSGTDRGLVGARLTELLADRLADRFAAGVRPAGFDDVPPVEHARYLAAGLVQLLLLPPSGASRPTPTQRATRAWRLIAPVSSAVR